MNNIRSQTNDLTLLEINNRDIHATLLMRAEQEYAQGYTLEVILKFSYKQHGKEGPLMQKEFKIEHHPIEKSTHNMPHVQLHIHGPLESDKVGQMWITLPLETEGEYIRCIEGFIHLLEDVMRRCEPDLEKYFLDLDEVKKLLESRHFLISTISQSLKNKGIEYQNPEGKKIFLTPNNIDKVIAKDVTLLPFFTK